MGALSRPLRLAAAVSAAVLSLGTASCYLVEPPPQPEPSPQRGPLLDGMDPCELISEEEATDLDLGIGSDTHQTDYVGSSECGWAFHSGSLNVVFDHYFPLSEQGSEHPEHRPTTVHDRPATLLLGNEYDVCTVALRVGRHNSVYVESAPLFDHPTEPCREPLAVAELIEPRLPGG